MLAALQFGIKFILNLGMKLMAIFIIACAVLVIVSFIRGDIKININIVETKEEDK